LPFFAENIFAAIFNALAFIRLRFPPAPNFGSYLTNLLSINTRNLDRGLIRCFDRDAFRNVEIDIMAETELQVQDFALHRSTITNTVDFEHLGETFGHTVNKILDQRALHTPKGACAGGFICWLNLQTIV